jgi:hypothetical protein
VWNLDGIGVSSMMRLKLSIDDLVRMFPTLDSLCG